MGSTLGAEVDGHLTGRGIGDQHRHRERVHPRWPPRAELAVLLVHGGEPADAGAQHDGDPLGGDASDEGLGHGPGLAGGQ